MRWLGHRETQQELGRYLKVIEGQENMMAELRGLGSWTLFENRAFGSSPERNIF